MSQRRIWLVAFLFFAGVCIAGWLVVAASDRAETIEEAQRSLAATVRVLEHQAHRALLDGDELLGTIVQRYRALPETVDPQRLAAFTREIAQMTSMVGAAGAGWVVDREGRIVAETWSYPPQTPGTVSDRAYFVAHRDGEEGLHLGAMETGRLTGRLRFTLSRPILGPGGGFEGVAAVGIYSDDFVDAFEDADLGEGSVLTLALLDGTPLARWGDIAEADGASPTGPAPSVRATRRLPDYPVEVSAARPLEAVLAHWRLRALQTGGLTFALVAGFLGLTLLGQRAVRDEEQARADLAAANRSLEARIEARTADLAAAARQMRLVSDAVPAAIAFVDASERYAFVNAGHRALWPRSGDHVVGSPVVEVVGDLVYRKIGAEIAAALRGERRAFELDLPGDAGSPPRTLQATYVPNLRADGTPDGFFALLMDITAHKADEERLRLLIGELDHRVRNTLAMILAMITQTEQRPGSKEAFAHDLRERIRALARTQALLTQSRWTGADLRTLVEQELTPHGAAGERFEAQGPDLVLAPKPALSIGLLLHELATNAAKHGALGVPQGRVQVRWRLLGSGAEAMVEVEWREVGGPPVAPPTRKGFGSDLIERVIAYDLGAQTAIAFPESGVVCRLRIPAARALVRKSEPPSISAQTDAAPAPARRTGAILLVEDDAFIAFDTLDALRALGHAVIGPCAGVAEALALVEREAPAFALLDVNLGEETSFPVAERLAAMGIPFALITGYDAVAIPAAYEEAPLLQKPATHEEIGTLVARFVTPRAAPPRADAGAA